MKKSFLVLCLMLLTMCVSAQEGRDSLRESKKGILEITDYVGASMSTLSVDGEHPYKNAWGPEFAVGVRYYVNNYFYTEGLLDFTNYRSYSLKDVKNYGYIYNDLNLYNINLPIHLGAFIPTTRKGGLHIYTGPSIRFNVYGKLKSATTNSKGKTIEERKNANINTVNLGIDFGLLYNFGGFAIGINYDLGVTELSTDSKTRESVLSIRVQYNVPLGKKK